jgi:hypothetical protein
LYQYGNAIYQTEPSTVLRVQTELSLSCPTLTPSASASVHPQDRGTFNSLNNIDGVSPCPWGLLVGMSVSRSPPSIRRRRIYLAVLGWRRCRLTSQGPPTVLIALCVANGRRGCAQQCVPQSPLFRSRGRSAKAASRRFGPTSTARSASSAKGRASRAR